MFILKDIIFDFFGLEAKNKDSYKDVNGKGVWERYNESVAEDYDEQVQPLISNLLDNILVPKNMYVRFLDIQNESLGNLPVPSTEVSVRRKIIRYFNVLGNIKGTLKSYKMLYSFIGITLDSYSDVGSDKGWDSNTTLDDDERTFDNNVLSCGYYLLDLSGSEPISSELENSINIINNYLKPINSKAVEIKYNGTPITIQ